MKTKTQGFSVSKRYSSNYKEGARLHTDPLKFYATITKTERKAGSVGARTPDMLECGVEGQSEDSFRKRRRTKEKYNGQRRVSEGRFDRRSRMESNYISLQPAQQRGDNGQWKSRSQRDRPRSSDYSCTILLWYLIPPIYKAPNPSVNRHWWGNQLADLWPWMWRSKPFGLP